MVCRSVPAFLALLLVIVDGDVAKPPPLLLSKEELIHTRHDHPPLDKTADPAYPTSKFSSLMTSPCRPEDDGYFGSTVGTPLVMGYMFELETRSFQKLDLVLEALNENLADTIISGVFPRVCDPERGTAEARTKVSGFHFTTEKLDMRGTWTTCNVNCAWSRPH